MKILEENFSFKQVPGLFLVKTLDSTYLGGSFDMANFFGYSDPDHLVNESDYTIKHKIAEHADLFIKTDNRLKETGKHYSGCYIFTLNNVCRAYIFKKAFLKNKSGENIGIISHSMEVGNRCLEKIIINFQKNNSYYCKSNKNKPSANYIANDNYPINFTKRESECLFYLLRGKSSHGIATILQLSTRTIESYVEKIKSKMNCMSKADLIEKAVKQGYIDIIPPSLLKF